MTKYALNQVLTQNFNILFNHKLFKKQAPFEA